MFGFIRELLSRGWILEIERSGGGRRRYRSEGHCCCRQEAQNYTGNTVERIERAGRGAAELAADQVKSEPGNIIIGARPAREERQAVLC